MMNVVFSFIYLLHSGYSVLLLYGFTLLVPNWQVSIFDFFLKVNLVFMALIYSSV